MAFEYLVSSGADTRALETLFTISPLILLSSVSFPGLLDRSWCYIALSLDTSVEQSLLPMLNVSLFDWVARYGPIHLAAHFFLYVRTSSPTSISVSAADGMFLEIEVLMRSDATTLDRSSLADFIAAVLCIWPVKCFGWMCIFETTLDTSNVGVRPLIQQYQLRSLMQRKVPNLVKYSEIRVESMRGSDACMHSTAFLHQVCRGFRHQKSV